MAEPMWCADRNEWVRFEIAADGRATVRVARRNHTNPYLTQPWETVTNGIWHIFDGSKSGVFQHIYYCLHEGFLYQTYNHINPITGKVPFAKSAGINRWTAYPTNPFTAYSFPDTCPPLSTLVPLTPEQELKKWADLKERIFSSSIELITSPELRFDEHQKRELLEQLSAIPELLASSYPTHEAYLLRLNNIIHNTEDPAHIAIVALAARTVDFVTIPGDSSSLAKKKSFYFELMRKTHTYVTSQFSAPTLLHVSPPPSADVAKPHALSITKIKAAVKTAQENYARWYRGDSLRGANGFFSWIRHGAYGQTRAVQIKTAIESLSQSGEAIVQINEFLTAGTTRYNRHSFASFLLDQLRTIDDSPWSSFAPIRDGTGTYDKNSVITSLARGQTATLR